MSEIRFVRALGEAIETAIADQPSISSRPRLRLRRLHLRGRLMVAVGLMVLGGAAFAATRQNSTTLATSGLACYEGASTRASAYYDVDARGHSPQVACAEVFGTSGPRALAHRGVKLVACANPHGYVAVFKANGSTGQCEQLGMTPLAAAGYTAAEARVQRLVSRLRALTPRGACVPVPRLLADVRRALGELGWQGWHPAIQHQLGGGPCGRFEATGSSSSGPAASLDSQRKTIWIVAGSP
jgi:hypothetical protein